MVDPITRDVRCDCEKCERVYENAALLAKVAKLEAVAVAAREMLALESTRPFEDDDAFNRWVGMAGVAEHTLRDALAALEASDAK